jgi:hypothetical protein
MLYFNPLYAIHSTDMKLNIEYSFGYLENNLILSYEISYLLMN